MLQKLQIYFFSFLTFSLFSFLLFHLPFFQHQKIIFFRGIEIIILSSIINFCLFLAIKHYFFKISLESIINSIIFAISIHICLLIVFPVTFERSLTMHMLNKINQKPTTQKDIEKNLIEEYIISNDAVSKRITEQSLIKFIKNDDKTISLTKSGEKFLKFSQIIKKIYGVNP